MVRGDEQRRILLILDNAIQALARDLPDHAGIVRLAGVHHNLLRAWAEA